MSAAVCGPFLAATPAIVATTGDEDDGSRSRQPHAPPRRPRWRIRGSAAVLRERLARGRRCQRRVVAEDRLFERSQLRARLDSKVAGQPLPAVAVARERIGLAPVAVERKHQLPEHVLVVRLGRDGALKVGNQLVVATEDEGQVNALGPGGAPLVVEPRRREAGVPLECDIGQCIPPPEAERLVECLQRLVQLVRGHRGACSVETLGEARGVDVARVTLDDVSGCTGDDDRGVTERAPEP